MVSIGLKQAYDFRDSLYKVYNEELTSKKPNKFLLTRLMSAWAIADERIRIHRGKPMPGVLRWEAKSKIKAKVIDTFQPLELAEATNANDLPKVDTDVITDVSNVKAQPIDQG